MISRFHFVSYDVIAVLWLDLSSYFWSAYRHILFFVSGLAFTILPKKPEAIRLVCSECCFQAAMTTVLLVTPLYFYTVYLYVTFAKTVLLIASIGLIHTVFVVPLIISIL